MRGQGNILAFATLFLGAAGATAYCLTGDVVPMVGFAFVLYGAFEFASILRKR